MRYAILFVFVGVLLGSISPARADACLDLLAKPDDAAACIARSTKEAQNELDQRLQALRSLIAQQKVKAKRRQMAVDLQRAQDNWRAYVSATCDLEADVAAGTDEAAYAGSLCRRRLIDMRTKDVADLTKKLR